jgi:hypothetical protein
MKVNAAIIDQRLNKLVEELMLRKTLFARHFRENGNPSESAHDARLPVHQKLT